MGTSVSQPSPTTTGWRSVATCYQSEQIPTERIASEVWRAATGPQSSLTDQIKSKGVFECFQLAQRNTPQERIAAALERITDEHGNSMVLEFAKRATLISSKSSRPASQWPKDFFKQVTGYLVARDASGFVGPNNRSKTVGDLIALKAEIGEHVARRVLAPRTAVRSIDDWSKVADSMLSGLASRK